VTCWSKKQDVVSCSNAEAEYRVMTHITCKMIWLKNLLMKLNFRNLCIVITSLSSVLPRILYSMKGPHTLRLTITLSEMLGPRR